MDEVELLRSWGDVEAAPDEASVHAARAALATEVNHAARKPRAAMASLEAWARRRTEGGLGKVAMIGAIATAAIMTQPHVPLGLPGHRALGWLSLLLIMRLVGGTGWASFIGLASAAGTMAIHRSPNGTFWGVAQYVLAGIGIDAFFSAMPRAARNPFLAAGICGVLLVLVGWITPVSNSFVAGVPLNGIWVSLASVGAGGWEKLISYDLVFGIGAGGIGFAVAWVLSQSWRDLGRRVGLRAGL